MTAKAIYRPQCIVRMKIRLEDFGPAASADAETEFVPFKQRLVAATNRRKRAEASVASARANSNASDRAALSQSLRELKAAQRTENRIRDAAAQAAPQTLGQGDEFSVDVYAVPIDLTLDLNGFRISDTCSFKVPFRDAPLVSELIRSALVEVFMGTVPPEDFAQPDRWVMRNERSQLMFRGYVDTWDTEHSEDDATISIEARSLEAILIDGKLNALSKTFSVEGEMKISDYVSKVLAAYPPTSGNTGGDVLKAQWYGADPNEEPKLTRRTLLRSLQSAKSRNQANGAVSGQTPPVSSQTPQGGTAAGGFVGPTGTTKVGRTLPSQEMSVWDLITQACLLVGAMPVYDPTLPPRGGVDPSNTILIRPPNTMYESVDNGVTIAGGAVDGFNRTLRSSADGSPVQSNIRFMVWGRNIKNITTSRKLGRVKAPAVEVIAYNPDAAPKERQLRVRYPSTKRASRIGAKGEAPIDTVITRVVRGIRDEKLLKQIAVGLYNSLSRQELSVELSTDDMASYMDPEDPTQPNDDPDLLRLRPGSPCRVLVARQVERDIALTPLSDVFEKRTQELARFLSEQAGRFRPDLDTTQQRSLVNQSVARLSDALQRSRLTDVYYCRTVRHSWGSDGFSSSLELVNFIEARSQADNLSVDDTQTDAERREVKAIVTPSQETLQQRERALERLESKRRGY